MRKIARILAQLPAYANTAIAVIAVLYLTLMPHPLPDNTPPMFPGADKIVHAVMMYLIATASAFDIYLRRRQLSWHCMVMILTSTIAFGGAIEVAQYLMAMGRGAEWTDFLADCIGALVAYWTAPRIVRWLLG